MPEIRRMSILRLNGRRAVMAVLACLACVTAGILPACTDHEPAMARGDRFWAEEDYEKALAEYRLAASQSRGDVDALRRVAHGFARTGNLIRARESYDQLLERAPEYTDQAVFDYMEMARERMKRQDRYGMAEAVEAALALRPELSLPDLAEPLARYYADNAQPERALVYFERALAYADPEEDAPLLYEIGRAKERQGNCREAIGYFEAYVRRTPRGEMASSARFHWGRCAFHLGQEARNQGMLTQALEMQGTVVRLGMPENVQDQSWFEQGEILFALGRFDEALEAYQRVLDLNPTREGQLVERARRGIDRIRFRDE